MNPRYLKILRGAAGAVALRRPAFVQKRKTPGAGLPERSPKGTETGYAESY
jgi:hypothetical protein